MNYCFKQSDFQYCVSLTDLLLQFGFDYGDYLYHDLSYGSLLGLGRIGGFGRGFGRGFGGVRLL
jgi:hypothetical protein